jgi:hypothetical protein
MLDTAEVYNYKMKTTESFQMAQDRNSCTITPIGTKTFLVAGGFSGGTTDPLGLDGTSVTASEIFTKP